MPELKFEGSFEDQSINAGTDIAAVQDQSLHSYMDSDRSDFFANETVDGVARNTIVTGIRENILKRMKQENEASDRSAQTRKGEHDNHKSRLVRDLEPLRGKRADLSKTEGELHSAISLMYSGRFSKLGYFERNFTLPRKIRNLEAERDKKLSEIKSAEKKVMDNAESWAGSLRRYRSTVYAKHFKEYDSLAEMYYKVTREFDRQAANPAAPADAANPALANPVAAAPADAAAPANPADAAAPANPAAAVPANPAAAAPGNQRAIRQDAQKRIKEYAGIYDPQGLQTFMTAIETQPNYAFNKDSIPVKFRHRQGADSVNIYDDANKTVTHTRILMETEEAGTPSVRYKVDDNFEARMSKRQRPITGGSVPVPVNPMDVMPDSFHQPMHAENIAALSANKRDVHGRYLESEESAAIVSARLKRNGARVHGFYMNDQFVTDEDTSDNGGIATGKEGMQYSGRPDWDKQGRAEKLRAAIRQSSFFKHVNARTIQYYASYNSEEITGQREGEMLDYRAALQQRKDNHEQVVDPTDISFAAQMDRIPEGELSQAMAAYILDNPGALPSNSVNDLSTDRVLSRFIAVHSERLPEVAAYLLAANDPARWKLGRAMIEFSSHVSRTTKLRLKYLPESGELMRLGLLEELNKNFKQRQAMTEEDPLGLLNFDRYNVFSDELMNRRGKRNAAARGFFTGAPAKKILSFAGNTTGAAITGAMGVREQWLGSPDTMTSGEKAEWGAALRETALWTSYGEMLTTFLSNPILGSAGFVASLGTAFPGTGEGAGRDIVTDFGSLNSVLKDIVKIYSAITKLWRKRKGVKETQRKGEDQLEDLDFKTARDIIKITNCSLNIATSIMGIIGTHMTTFDSDDALTGAVGDFAGPQKWINGLIDIGRQILGVADDILVIIAANRRIGRIDSFTQGKLKTAMDSVPEGRVPDPADAEQLMGVSARDSAHTRYFMSLTRQESRKERSAAGWDISSRASRIAKDICSLVPTAEAKIAKAVFTVAPYITDFIGWTIGKLKYDRQNFNMNIATMLGDKSYSDTPYFNDVLKRETGIVNKHYLVDLARIFMSIDTHALIQNSDFVNNRGDAELAMGVVGTLYGKSNVMTYKQIQLKDMLRYAGVDARSNWRSLLRNSLMV